MSNTHFRFRSAEFPADSARIREIVAAVWSGGGAALVEAEHGQVGDSPWQVQQSEDVLAWLQAENASAYVVESEKEPGCIAGFCSFQLDRHRDTATVGYNAVAPESQGQGLGKLMMAYVMEQIHATGVGHAAVIVAENDDHLPAMRIYEKAGFKTVYNLRYMFQKLR